jgi:hypothetical protein
MNAAGTNAPSGTARRLRNPFATRFTQPGRLAPHGIDGLPLDLVRMLDQLAAVGGSGAIEGPHGSGKTTLLVALADRLMGESRLGGLVRLRSPGDAVSALRRILRAAPGTTICIDSWERMGTAAATLARWFAWRRGCGLLVTSHRRTGLPSLIHCRTSAGLLERLVSTLPDHGGLIAGDDIAAAHAAHGGNLREALLDLYDRFERRCR